MKIRRDHPDLLEADFQQFYTLDIALVTPARAARLLFQLPNESRLVRFLSPANNWDWTQILLNKAVYFLEVLAWQKTKDGQKKAPQNQPKMYQPPFMIKAAETAAINAGSELHTTDDIRDILARPRNPAK